MKQAESNPRFNQWAYYRDNYQQVETNQHFESVKMGLRSDWAYQQEHKHASQEFAWVQESDLEVVGGVAIRVQIDLERVIPKDLSISLKEA